MRTTEQMMHLILSIARADESIRAVVLNGSRANPNAPRDILQDFDVVYIVTDAQPYNHNWTWLAQFGERAILQMPDEMGDDVPDPRKVVYLMQFTDGNRIDLSIATLERWREEGSDSLTVTLLDKDGILGSIPAPTEADYWVSLPTEAQYRDCCNEFWWVLPYVARGLWRGEITYAQAMFNEVCREELLRMLAWEVGARHAFEVNVGKAGKWLQRYLTAEDWQALLATYAGGEVAEIWAAVMSMEALFGRVGRQVGERFGYAYPQEDEKRVLALVDRIHRTTPGADDLAE